MGEPGSHNITIDAGHSRAPWTKLWSLESLRYRGSGWWLDAVLPHAPLALVAAALLLPAAWFAAAYALTPDTAALVDTPDIMG